MLTIRCCAPPPPREGLRLPKRIERIRRVAESKRLDSLKEFHEALKKTAKDEHAFVKDFFSKTQDMWKDLAAEEDKDDTPDEE
jgi:hypothetical protein